MSDYDTDVICDSCLLSWSMTKNCGDGTYCPYCGKEQIKHSATYDNIKARIERELANYEDNPDNTSCTDDYSYWWGYIDAMEKKEHISNEESIELSRLKDKLKEYRERSVGI